MHERNFDENYTHHPSRNNSKPNVPPRVKHNFVENKEGYLNEGYEVFDDSFEESPINKEETAAITTKDGKVTINITGSTTHKHHSRSSKRSKSRSHRSKGDKLEFNKKEKYRSEDIDTLDFKEPSENFTATKTASFERRKSLRNDYRAMDAADAALSTVDINSRENNPTMKRASNFSAPRNGGERFAYPELSTEEEDGGTVKVVHFGVV